MLIDSDVLASLPARHVSNGLAESVKMAATHDPHLFELLEQTTLQDAPLEEIVLRSLAIKKQVVEADEHENGLRKVLNFGHTLGHAIESVCGLDTYYHGECVALGMLPMCSDSLRPRVKAILEKLNLPTTCTAAPEAVWAAMCHDKKLSGDTLTVVFAPKAGSFVLRAMPLADLEETVRAFLGRKE